MRTLLLIFCLAILLMLTACNSSGTLKVINRSSYNIYITIDGKDIIIPGNTSKSVEVDTGKETVLTGTRTKEVPLVIYGETWMIRIYEYDEAVYLKNTNIKINSGETYKIYCDPILAAVKVKNYQDLAITAMSYTIHHPPFSEFTREIILPDSIQKDEEFFSPLPPANVDDIFYYTFNIKLADGTWIPYGDESTILYVDQEKVIDVIDVSKYVTKIH